MRKIKTVCPYCDGKGYMTFTYKHLGTMKEKTKRKAFLLRKQGLSLREIGERVGIKHPQTVKYAIESYVRDLVKTK